MRKRLTNICALVLGAGLAGLFWGSSAQAATEGPLTTTSPIPSTTTDWSSSLAFPQFNPSLGTLTSVEIYLSGGLTTQLTVTNNDESSSSYGTAKTEVQISAQDVGSDLVVPELDMYSSPAFSYSLAAGGSIVSGLLTQTGTSDETYTSSPVLAEFTGVSSYSLPASTFTQTVLSNTGGNTDASQVTTAYLTGSVTYTYSVPEPASLGLIVAALPLLAARRRRHA